MRPARENMCRGARYHKTPHLVFCLTFFLVCVAIGKVPFSGDEIVTVESVFRIHGTEHPLQLRIDLHPEGDTITLKTHFIVPYVNWGEATISAGE